MKITINHDEYTIEPGTVAELLAKLEQDKPGVAAALNGAVLRRTLWAETPLQDGDRLDLFSVIAGG